MANKMYGRTALTGGVAGCLDSIDGARLFDGDIAVVVNSSGEVSFYRLNAVSNAAESSPGIITPDTNAMAKRWILANGRFGHINDDATGTFTPGIAFGGGTTGITYSTQSGNYTKIGNAIIASGFIVLTNRGSSDGELQITGFPVPMGPSWGMAGCFSFAYLNSITYTGQIQGLMQINTTIAKINQTTEAGVFSSLTRANTADTTSMVFTVIYMTA